MNLSIIEVKPKDNFHLLLTFENGEKKVFDMNPYLEIGIFRELKEPELFNTVSLCFDSIEWDNEADLDPEFLYQNSRKIACFHI